MKQKLFFVTGIAILGVVIRDQMTKDPNKKWINSGKTTAGRFAKLGVGIVGAGCLFYAISLTKPRTA